MGMLEGRTALVTGGSHGIGLAIVLAFAREGADVAIADRRPVGDADETVREIAAMGRLHLSSRRTCRRKHPSARRWSR